MPKTPPRYRKGRNDSDEQPMQNATHMPPGLASVHQSTTPLRKENQGRLNLRPRGAKESPVVGKAMPKPPPALRDRLPRASNIRHTRKTSPDRNSRRHHPINENVHQTPALEKRQSLESVDIRSLGPDSGLSADSMSHLDAPRMASVRQALAMLQESTTQHQAGGKVLSLGTSDNKKDEKESLELMPIKSTSSSQFSFSDLQKIKQLIASQSPPRDARRPRRQNSEPPPNIKKRSFSAHSNCLISFSPLETPPAPQEKDDAELGTHLVIDVFRDGRPPKRRRPSLVSSTAQMDYRDKMDFDSEDLKCFENLPPEKRSRLLFVCKLKPLLCPESTMVDYLARIDLRKVSRLMTLQTAFESLSHASPPPSAPDLRPPASVPVPAAVEHSPASFGGPSPVGPAVSVGPSVSVTQDERSPCELKPFTPMPFRAASPPLIQLDCPTNLTGFRTAATPQTFERLLDGYEMSAARERVVSTTLNLRSGPFDFLGLVRCQVLDLLSVSPPPVIDVCGSLCAFNELHVCKGIHLQLSYAAVCVLFKSFDQWLLEGFKNVKTLRSETKKTQLLQVHSADRFIRRCFLMRIAVDLQTEWNNLNANSRKKFHRAQWCQMTNQPFARNLVSPAKLTRNLSDPNVIEQIIEDIQRGKEKQKDITQQDDTIKHLLLDKVSLEQNLQYMKGKQDALRRFSDQDVIELAIAPNIKIHNLKLESQSQEDPHTLSKVDLFIDSCEAKLAQAFARRLRETTTKRERFKTSLEMRLATFVKMPAPPDSLASDGCLHLRQSVSDFFAPSVIQRVGGLRTTIKIGPGNDIGKPPGPLPSTRGSLSGQESMGRSSAGRSSLGASTPNNLRLDLSELHRIPLTPLPTRASEGSRLVTFTP